MFGFSGFDSRVASQMLKVSKKLDFFAVGVFSKTLLLMVQKSGKHQLRLVFYPIIYKLSYIPRGAGFLPSTVVFGIPKK